MYIIKVGVAMVGNETNQSQGFLNTVKEKVPVESLIEKFNDSRSLLLDIGLYGGIGLLTGFFMRKYSTLVMFGVLMVIGLYALEHLKFIMINWDVVYATFGVQSSSMITSDHFIQFFVEWIKSNVAAATSFVVGFLLGLKVG